MAANYQVKGFPEEEEEEKEGISKLAKQSVTALFIFFMQHESMRRCRAPLINSGDSQTVGIYLKLHLQKIQLKAKSRRPADY